MSFFVRLKYISVVVREGKKINCIALFKTASERVKVNDTHFSQQLQKDSGGIYF